MSSDRAPEGAFVHLDVLSNDPKATRHFLEAAFAWRSQTIPFAEHALFEAPAAPHGGLRAVGAGETPGLRGYVAVDSLDDARHRIEKAGGRVVGDDQRVPGFGRFFTFEAPGGLVMAAFEETRGP